MKYAITPSCLSPLPVSYVATRDALAFSLGLVKGVDRSREALTLAVMMAKVAKGEK